MVFLYNFIAIEPITSLEGWAFADEALAGSRVKRTVINPTTNKNYVFKEPKNKREAQIWSELIASYIAGDLLGWEIQHVSIANNGDRYGNLMAYIYKAREEVFIDGWRICRNIDPNYDTEKGEHHTLPLLMEVGKYLSTFDLAEASYFDFWGRAFAFDALISNSDRHGENWAVIRGKNGLRMAPLYDNATSMGCEWDEQSLTKKWFDPKNGAIITEKVDAHISKGRHHVRLNLPASRGGAFAEVCTSFLKTRPEQRPKFEAIANLNLDQIFRLLVEIQGLDIIPAPYSMTENRAAQISELLKSGQERIKNILS
jgi:HipA-like C-terminal domain